MMSEKAKDGFILSVRDNDSTYHVKADYYLVDNNGALIFLEDAPRDDPRAECGRIMLCTFAPGTWLQVSDAAKWGDERLQKAD